MTRVTMKEATQKGAGLIHNYMNKMNMSDDDKRIMEGIYLAESKGEFFDWLALKFGMNSEKMWDKTEGMEGTRAMDKILRSLT